MPLKKYTSRDPVPLTALIFLVLYFKINIWCKMLDFYIGVAHWVGLCTYPSSGDSYVFNTWDTLRNSVEKEAIFKHCCVLCPAIFNEEDILKNKKYNFLKFSSSWHSSFFYPSHPSSLCEYVQVYTVYTVCNKRGGGSGCLESIYRSWIIRYAFDQILNLQNLLYHPKQNLGGEGAWNR